MRPNRFRHSAQTADWLLRQKSFCVLALAEESFVKSSWIVAIALSGDVRWAQMLRSPNPFSFLSRETTSQHKQIESAAAVLWALSTITNVIKALIIKY